MDLRLSEDAREFIRGLEKSRRWQIAQRINDLLEHPYDGVKKLKGYDFYRARSGDYRIVFRIEGDTLDVALVEQRGDDEIYKILKRRFG